MIDIHRSVFEAFCLFFLKDVSKASVIGNFLGSLYDFTVCLGMPGYAWVMGMLIQRGNYLSSYRVNAEISLNILADLISILYLEFQT